MIFDKLIAAAALVAGVGNASLAWHPSTTHWFDFIFHAGLALWMFFIFIDYLQDILK